MIATPVVSKVFRFNGTYNSASPINVLFSDVLNYVTVALDTTHLSNIFETCRIARVEAWAQATGLVGCNLGIEFPSNNTSLGAISRRAVGSSLSTARPVYVSLTPAPGSQQAMWNQTSSDIAFILNGPTTSALDVIIDVHVSYNMFDTTVAPATHVVAGATAGAVYYRALDAARTFLPVELPTL